jgi:hypothetical protein
MDGSTERVNKIKYLRRNGRKQQLSQNFYIYELGIPSSCWGKIGACPTYVVKLGVGGNQSI